MQTLQGSKKEKQEVDRISSLPEHLLHSFMFMLWKRDAARMSILSKGWYGVWTRFPIIDIDEENYGSRQDFIQGLRSYLQRHHFDHLQKLSLRTIMPMTEEIYQHIDKFVVHAATCGNLQNLHLKFHANRRSGKMYIVPGIVFSNASSLTSLMVAGCDFKSYEVLNLHLLRTLKLRHVQIEDDLIQRLMQACPLLENFSLQYYNELKSIKIIHKKIRIFALSIDEELEELQIHLPNLQLFKYKGYYSFGEGYMTASKFETLSTVREYTVQSFYLKYALLEAQTFQNLQLKHVRRLQLHFIDVESEALWFTSLQFPFLAFLSLKGCKGLQEVNVTSSEMKSFFIEDCVDMKHCKMMAPNLLFFKYQGPIIRMAQQNASARLQVNLIFKQPIDHGHDLLQLLRLRNSLRAFHGANEMTIQLADICQECMNMFQAVRYLF